MLIEATMLRLQLQQQLQLFLLSKLLFWPFAFPSSATSSLQPLP